MSRTHAPAEPSPEVRARMDVLREALKDGPVPVRAIGGRDSPYQQITDRHARRHLGVELVTVEGERCYRVPEPSS
jgi:hypothetical protein